VTRTKPRIVNTDALAEACNLTPRRIRMLVAGGVIPRLRPGRFNLITCLRAYIAYLTKALAGNSTTRGTSETANTTQQRAKLLDVELAREELALAKDRSAVMSVDDHGAVLAHMASVAIARVMSLGARVSAQLSKGKPSREKIMQVIDAEARIVLSEIGKVAPAMPREAGA
jgi:hypothetical protein